MSNITPLDCSLEISEVVGKVMGKIVGGKLKVFPEDANAHRKIQNFISVKKLKSHTYEMAGEKQLKTVIRGLPSDFDVDEIIQELGTHNITPEHVSVMRNRKQNKNMPLFSVVSRKCPANQAIFQVTSIGIELGNNTHLTLSCIYKPPRNHINTSELDAILNASPKVMLLRQIKTQISEHRNNSWHNLLTNLHPEDNSFTTSNGSLLKSRLLSPAGWQERHPLFGRRKAEEFKNNLEATFQENAEPYNDQIIELVESETSDFLANSSMQVPPLTSPAEISKIINKLQKQKASGPDNIPNYALKLLPLNAITHLTKIINTCLKHRFFSFTLKSANVIMLPKPNQNHKLAQNYRPISLLCATAKIYEKIILNRIKQHCDTINCIPPEQCGFRNNHSTTHQLIRVTKT
ncbi:RNA-directed DNA polymerase from mobile element jockey [Trichonephila clavipes]|nr:RNA-directed DNA polymerase from mobile element jockey [Trichonephila clavipes]